MYMSMGGLLISNGAGPSKKPLINRDDGYYCLRAHVALGILVRFAIPLKMLYMVEEREKKREIEKKKKRQKPTHQSYHLLSSNPHLIKHVRITVAGCHGLTRTRTIYDGRGYSRDGPAIQ